MMRKNEKVHISFTLKKNDKYSILKHKCTTISTIFNHQKQNYNLQIFVTKELFSCLESNINCVRWSYYFISRKSLPQTQISSVFFFFQINTSLMYSEEFFKLAIFQNSYNLKFHIHKFALFHLTPKRKCG